MKKNLDGQNQRFTDSEWINDTDVFGLDRVFYQVDDRRRNQRGGALTKKQHRPRKQKL
uniref:Uncharacterized protein n=1 Tax=Romanomermis culicivorax TaxID=13658 RepID=A0A915JKX0_ROMCU